MATIYKEMTTDRTRVCKCCGQELPIGAYPVNPRYRGMVGLTCKTCINGKKAATAERQRKLHEERIMRQEAERMAREKMLSRMRDFYKVEMRDGDDPLGFYTTWQLIVELSRRGRLYDNLAQDFRDMVDL